MLAVLLVAGCAQAAAAERETAATEVPIVAEDYRLELPQRISPGRHRFTFENRGHEPHYFRFVKLAEGRTLEDFLAWRKSHSALPGWLVPSGGGGTLAPGERAEYTADLSTGRYVVFCGHPDPQGTPHVDKGMYAALEVQGVPTTFEVPSDVDVKLDDGRMEVVPEFRSGKQTAHFVNATGHVHQALLILLPEGVTADDELAWFRGGSRGPRPGHPMGGVIELAPKQEAWSGFELRAGSYLLICAVTAPDGTRHFDHGMIHAFEIKAAAEDFYRAAQQAHQRKDYAAYVQNLQKVLDAGTRHPLIYLSLAGGHAQLGENAEAFTWLDRYAALGIAAPVEEDPDLQSLRTAPQFEALLQKFKHNLQPTQRSKIGFRLAEKRFIAEGVAYDPASRAFFVSSILQKKVVRVDRGGHVADFVADRKELGPVLGLSVDPRSHSLWVATSSIPELEPDQPPTSPGIYQYDLRSGALLAGYVLREPGAHTLGDVVPGPDGRAFTSDSASGGSVYVSTADGRLEEFVGSGLFRSPQGLCFTPDGRTLFVADYVRGLFGFDVRSRQSFRLEPPKDATLVGIDGLYFHGGALIATQNGVKPNRVLRITLAPASADQARRSIEAVTVLESNHPLFEEITLGVVVRDALYYVANGQFDRYLADPAASLQAPLILKLPLR